MSGEYAYDGSDFTPRGPLYLNSLEGVDAADIGIGAVWCDGELYWCDGSAITSCTPSVAADVTAIEEDIVTINETLATAALIVEAPAAADSTGIAGQIAYDATHIYVCIATNTWVRGDLATWGA